MWKFTDDDDDGRTDDERCAMTIAHVSLRLVLSIKNKITATFKDQGIKVQMTIFHPYFPCSAPPPPREDAGVKVENTSSVSPACRKRRLNGAVCRNHRIKRVVPCRCRTGTLKNPSKCLWRWEPNRRYNYFFFSPPAHLWCHIYDWNIVACDVKHQ